MFKRLFRRSQPDAQVTSIAPDPPACRTSALIALGGHPELALLFITPSDRDIDEGLDTWRWLPIAELTPIAVSAFGDVFFEGDQGVVMLDTIEGKLSQVAGDAANLVALLQSEQARDELLLAGIVLRVRQLGILLNPGECYDFKVSPVLGGTMTAEDVHAMSFLIKLNIAGQIHDQVRNLPPGTRINSVKIAD